MKLLCVYDLAIIMPMVHDQQEVEAALEAFVEHDKAQDFFGFKVAITELFEIALDIPNPTPGTANGIIALLLQYLGGTERQHRFLFVQMDAAASAFISSGNEMSPHVADPNMQVLYDDLRRLIGWCRQMHLGKAHYASWLADSPKRSGNSLVGKDGYSIPIMHSCYDWGEAYRKLRRHPARTLA